MDRQFSPLPSLYGRLWAILPSYFRAMASAMQTRQVDPETLRQAAIEVADRRTTAHRSTKEVAVIPIIGPIEHRPSVMGQMCGFPSTMEVGAMFDAALAEPKVKSILLDIDSPGGVASGTPELAAKIFAARGQKPIVAIANTMAASAAYWIGTAADRLFVTPSGDVGSVGVFSIHEDYSGALEQEGVKVSIIKAGKFKAEMNPYEPLTDEGRDNEQQQVDEIYGDFLDAVARHRGTTASKVKADFGEGRTVSARKAVLLGMADRIATKEQVLARMEAGRLNVKGSSVSDEWDAEIQCEEPSGPDAGLLRRKTGLQRRSVR